MFSSQVLREGCKTNNLVRFVEPHYDETYLEFKALEMNDALHEIDTELNCDYYKLLTELSLSGVGDKVKNIDFDNIRNSIDDFIDRFLKFIDDTIRYFYDLDKEATKRYIEKKKSTGNFDTNFNQKKFDSYWNMEMNNNPEAKNDKATKEKRLRIVQDNFQNINNTEVTVPIWKYPMPNEIDPSSPIEAISSLTKFITDVCSGKGATDPSTDVLSSAMNTLTRSAKGTRQDYNKKVVDKKTFQDYVNTNVIYSNKQVIKLEDFINDARTVEPSLGKDFISKYTKPMSDELNRVRQEIKKTKGEIDRNEYSIVMKYLSYVRQVVNVWIWYIKQIQSAHTKRLNSYSNIYDRIMRSMYTKSTVSSTNESYIIETSTMFGEPFEGSTLFDNNDLRDFNRTEWLDLALTREIYALKYETDEYIKHVMLNEAMILTDDKPQKIARLNYVREAENKKFNIKSGDIFQTIKNTVTKFLATIKDIFGNTARFINNNKVAIEKRIREDLECNSKGDIIAGMYRIQDNIPMGQYDENTLKEDLQNKEMFFEKHIKDSLNKSSNFSKRKVEWKEGVSITDFCKAYYGASMPEDQYPMCKFTGVEFEQNKKNIIDFLTHINIFMNAVNTDLSKLEQESKKNTREKEQQSASKSSENTQNNSSTSNNTTQESYNCLLLDRVITEAEITNGETENQNDNQNNSEKATKPANLFNVYMNAYKDVLLSKITAIQFITSEFMQVLKNHVESNPTNKS